MCFVCEFINVKYFVDCVVCQFNWNPVCFCIHYYLFCNWPVQKKNEFFLCVCVREVVLNDGVLFVFLCVSFTHTNERSDLFSYYFFVFCLSFIVCLIVFVLRVSKIICRNRKFDCFFLSFEYWIYEFFSHRVTFIEQKMDHNQLHSSYWIEWILNKLHFAPNGVTLPHKIHIQTTSTQYRANSIV